MNLKRGTAGALVSTRIAQARVPRILHIALYLVMQFTGLLIL